MSGPIESPAIRVKMAAGSKINRSDCVKMSIIKHPPSFLQYREHKPAESKNIILEWPPARTISLHA